MDNKKKEKEREEIIMTYRIWFCEYYGTLENEDCNLSYDKVLYEDIKEEDLQKYVDSVCKEFHCDKSKLILGKYAKLENGVFDKNRKFCLFMEELVDIELEFQDELTSILDTYSENSWKENPLNNEEIDKLVGHLKNQLNVMNNNITQTEYEHLEELI